MVKIYCLPSEVDEKSLNEIYENIKERIAKVRELKITPDIITVLYVPDMMKKGLGDEIIVDIEKLLDEPERNTSVLFRAVENVGVFLESFTAKWPFKKPDRIGVFLQVFDNREKNIYWTNKQGGKFYKIS